MTASLEVMLRALKLPGIGAHYADLAVAGGREGWSFTEYLTRLAEIELSERKRRRIERLLKQSQLPADKTLATLDLDRLPAPVRRMFASLCEGGFADRGENVLAFGLPGRGKTHVVAAIGHELVRRGFSVLFVAAFALVQRLLVARRELRLEKALRELDTYDVIALDDIGYIQQDREEMEVLFTFLAERYERRSVMITSNLVFSQWDRIFKDPMTTAAAIDRLVHHATILEMTGRSVRNDAAQARLGTQLAASPSEAASRSQGGVPPRGAGSPSEGEGPPRSTGASGAKSGGPSSGSEPLAGARGSDPFGRPPVPPVLDDNYGEDDSSGVIDDDNYNPSGEI